MGTCCNGAHPKFNSRVSAYPSLRPIDIIKTRLLRQIDNLQRKLILHRNTAKELHLALREQLTQYDNFYRHEIHPKKARDKRSILVYNINEDVELGEIRSHFELCGEIENVIMLFDRDKFLSRACVIFKHEVYAYIALCMNKTSLVGQNIRVLPWNLDFQLEVIQLIVKKWGTMLESRFKVAYRVRRQLRVITAISKHRYELMALYLKATMYSKDASSEQLRELIAASLDSLQLLGKYPVSYLECDERLVD